jgi:DNA polymerase-3 subunit delta
VEKLFHYLTTSPPQMLSYSDFKKSKVLPNGAPLRVYGVLGDGFLQKRVTDALLEWILPSDARDFNLDTLDGETTSLTEVLARCGNLPFLADARVVLVQRAERLEGLHRSSESSDEGETKPKGKANKSASKGSSKAALSPAKRLSEAIESLPACTVLILMRTPETPEVGSRAVVPRCINAAVDKSLEKAGAIIDCTVPLKNAGFTIRVIQDEAVRRHIPLSPEAANHLVSRAGTDIELLLNELEKCSLRAGDGELVTNQIIDEMVKRAPQDTIFDLTDALGARNTPHAIGLMRELIAGGDAPERILATLVTHFRQLLQARAFLDARLPLDASLLQRLPPDLANQLPQDGKDNLANALQFQAWRGRRLAEQARNFSTEQIQAALESALSADLGMKGIEGDGGGKAEDVNKLLLELTVLNFGQ